MPGSKQEQGVRGYNRRDGSGAGRGWSGFVADMESGQGELIEKPAHTDWAADSRSTGKRIL
jgi:hypothetical protein